MLFERFMMFAQLGQVSTCCWIRWNSRLDISKKFVMEGQIFILCHSEPEFAIAPFCYCFEEIYSWNAKKMDYLLIELMGTNCPTSRVFVTLHGSGVISMTFIHTGLPCKRESSSKSSQWWRKKKLVHSLKNQKISVIENENKWYPIRNKKQVQSFRRFQN